MVIASLKKLIVEFGGAGAWKRFLDPKNLSAALVIESTELQELFLWNSEEEVTQ
jgi:hypothetical protein